MNTAQRRDLRMALVNSGFERASLTRDNGDGTYEEIWDDSLKFNHTFDRRATMVRISWGEKEKDLMTQFNVGDRVRVVESTDWNPEIAAGSVGTITEVDHPENQYWYPDSDWDMEAEPWAEYRVLIPEQGIPLWVNKVEAIDND